MMEQINEVIRRLNNNCNAAYSLIRIYLGVALLVRGLLLIADPNAIIQLVTDEKLHMWASYITIGHILGGLLIAIGYFTRFGALMQIPILLGAVFIEASHKGLMMGSQSLELASLVLFLLMVLFLFGSGTLSLDDYLQKRKTNASAGL